MSSSVVAPQQYKQPSRKGKKSWRKNVDVTEVQEGLRLLKDEEIKGYVLYVAQSSGTDSDYCLQWTRVRKTLGRIVRARHEGV